MAAFGFVLHHVAPCRPLFSVAHTPIGGLPVPIGPVIRRLFGRHERAVAAAYRAIFLDFDALLATVGRWAPVPDRILEVGCGEGAMTEYLQAVYPAATLTAIDVSPRIGRLFRGDRARVEFIQAPLGQIVNERPGAFDLVVMNDVLHHVPRPIRGQLLADVGRALAPNGVFFFKEWMRSTAPIHWLCEGSDRFITGDNVDYLTAPEARRLLEEHFGKGAIREEATVAPWRSNRAFQVCPTLSPDTVRSMATHGAP